jgi:hypothetical protein
MHITNIRIRNFRSIDDLPISLNTFTTICGPNSCGKSNVFRAIMLAFQTKISLEDAQQNLPSSKLVQGGPKLSIWVDCDFAQIPAPVKALAGSTSSSVRYSFRLTRGGNVTRKLGAKAIAPEEFEQLLKHFNPVYVPPIRDLGGDGLLPFKRLIKQALQRAKGPGNIRQFGDSARQLIQKKAGALLSQQSDLVNRLVGADKLSLDTAALDVESLYENIGLSVHFAGSEQPLSSLGTGHQSAVIMHLYRQLGEDMPGEVLYLFEEPDNHLHPATIRSICDDLIGISNSSQVLVSTHSPVFLSHVGFSPLRPLVQNSDGLTLRRDITLLDHYTEKQARVHLDSFGLRITEPLLSNRVIVVEGPTDKIVLSTLFELRQGKTVDQDNILVIAAGGKDRVALLSRILHCLDVKWRCVLDRDAASSADVPYSRNGLTAQENTDGIHAVDTLTALLETTTRRGMNAAKCLAAIRAELATTRPSRKLLENCALQNILDITEALDLTEYNELKNALADDKKRKAWKLLRKGGAFVWSTTLEEALVHNANAENCVETALIAAGEFSASLNNNASRKIALINKLHSLGNTPEVLGAVVTALENGNHFKRTEVNECYSVVFA